MSVKLRMTLWITLMAVLLAAMVLVFVLVINGSAITDDPAGSLVKIVLKNADNIEFDRGEFEWDDLDIIPQGRILQLLRRKRQYGLRRGARRMERRLPPA